MSRREGLYRRVVLPPVRLATRRDAEVAMEWHLRAMRALQADPRLLAAVARRHRPPVDGAVEGAGEDLLGQELMSGLRFPHPVGIAAGYDKNAAVHPAFEAHFSPGFIEVGTVTLRPQAGNPRPRIRRVEGDHLVNAMGFPNAGAEAVRANLERLPAATVPLGVNIGKLKETSEADAPAEYAQLVRHFGASARPPDYYVVNVSSPNTPGLRALQSVGPLTAILDAVTQALDEQTGLADRPRRRLLVKLAPELSAAELEAVVGLVLGHDIGGLVLTNTRRTDLPGGMSGPDLFPMSSAMVRAAARLLPADRVVVATGGVDSVERAYEVLAHADLVGIYTGLVFQGPGLLRRLREGIAERLRADGHASLAALRAASRPAAPA